MEMEVVPMLMLDLERFFKTYDREGKKISAEMRRFWRYNVAQRHLLVEDVKRFYASAGPEVAALQMDVNRFFAGAKPELRHMKKTLERFFTNERNPAYKDRSLPSDGDLPVKVFEDAHPSPTPIKESNRGL